LVDTFPLGRMESIMSNSKPPYPPELRRQILDLLKAGRSAEELARDYEPTATTIRNWEKQDAIDSGRRADGLTTEERAEIARLRREVRLLREERDILKKAAAWFAREAVPPRGSNS
jgi:transposase